MIVSSNKEPALQDFADLVFRATEFLNRDVSGRETYYSSRNAQRLEDDVIRAMKAVAVGTPFEDTIEKISGQKFPDIVAAKYFGVEVKSSKDEHWTTLGGSVNESTRVEGVERIFLLFGKLTSPIAFKSRPYEECLSEVVVTHYPRYKIDMNLPEGQTIFDKMDTTYDELRESGNPVGKIVEYYKGQLKEGERLWWIDSSDDGGDVSSASMKVKLFRTLSPAEKSNFMISGFALFPHILSNRNAKYEDFSLWLASQHGIVSTSLRDSFSAGGKGDIITAVRTHQRMPKALCKINQNREAIKERILAADESTLMENWKVEHIQEDRLEQWIELISQVCVMEDGDVGQVLRDIFT